MKQPILFFLLAAMLSLTASAQPPADKKQLRKWVRQDSAVSRRIYELQYYAHLANGNLYQEDTVLRNAQYALEEAEIRRIQKKDSVMIPQLQRLIQFLTAQKAATQQRFDSLLILLDSSFMAKEALERHIRQQR
jgi:hypothetical protein